MEQTRTTKRFFMTTALCLVLAIVLTRGYALKHNINGHPDEHVFYYSTEVLMLSLLDPDETYEPFKAYPEATYVFRLPFHLLAQVLPLDAEYNWSLSAWGRVASVFYYTLGALLGLWLVCNPLRGGRAGALIYVLAVSFGLFQIEQSRYGTFDPLSFFVLTQVIVFCTLALRRGKQRFLAAAAFAVGVAAAGKYPLAYFALLPLSVLLLQRMRGRTLAKALALMAGCALLGFILFSPSVLRSPRFFLSTVLGGLRGYVVGGNPEGYSTVPESVASVAIYHGLYSDLPLAGLFAFLCVRGLSREGENSAERRFFTRILPAVTLVFLAYNCFLTTFYLRTLFPYFCITMLYAAAGLGRLCQARGMRIAAVLLCLVMVARGTVLVALLGDKDGKSRAEAAVMEKLEESGEGEVLMMGTGFYSMDMYHKLHESAQIISTEDELFEGTFPELRPGMRILTASLEHGIVKHCLFPPNKEMTKNITQGWEAFKKEYEPWLAAKLYPDWIYPLFGYWVHGETATGYEFPTNWLYIRPAD